MTDLKCKPYCRLPFTLFKPEGRQFRCQKCEQLWEITIRYGMWDSEKGWKQVHEPTAEELIEEVREIRRKREQAERMAWVNEFKGLQKTKRGWFS